jgi:phosphoribosylaminoimidazolecarboxamide formyltransferase/IMP cyclohydrolase
MNRKVKSALISVYYKDGLDALVQELAKNGVVIYSTGGTQSFIEGLGIPVVPVEDLTGYPSILDGRVKTLHPKVFGGILARREADHLGQLAQYQIPEIDLVIVDLYPFEETVANTTDQATIIEKIDIGGISLIRAAAKNFNDVVIVPSRDDYASVLDILQRKNGCTDIEDRMALAQRAFAVSSHYDTAIWSYFSSQTNQQPAFKASVSPAMPLRYGENPHQAAEFFGPIEDMFDILGGKELSFNNLVDIDAAVNLMAEFVHDAPSFAILKHTNACGMATRPSLLEAWHAALAADPVSAFGGVFICNTTVDLDTANEINKLFYEVLIAPAFTDEALQVLQSKGKRILLRIKHFNGQAKQFKSILNGVLVQDADQKTEQQADLRVATNTAPTDVQLRDLVYAIRCVKHLKSNAIAIVKDGQLIGMGCGQTSRVDALNQALTKAKAFGFDVTGAVMASEAFFPFPDCVEIANLAGIQAVAQPGGSIKDQDSIDYCNQHGLAMVLSGIRHFKH